MTAMAVGDFDRARQLIDAAELIWSDSERPPLLLAAWHIKRQQYGSASSILSDVVYEKFHNNPKWLGIQLYVQFMIKSPDWEEVVKKIDDLPDDAGEGLEDARALAVTIKAANAEGMMDASYTY